MPIQTPSGKKTRKIRKTNELFHFDDSTSNTLNSTKQFDEVPIEPPRKIVKAKRLIKRQTLDVVEETVDSKQSTPLKPSLLNIDEKKSPIYFDSHSEDINPSSSGDTELKRRTFELETSINDISVLKTASENDSFRMSFHRSPSVRKRWAKAFTPTNKESPNWLLKLSGKKPESKVKIPNFAAIHQRALEKAESISEYKDRKEKRAKMLLSGKKPENGNMEPQSEIRKTLRFAPNIVSRTNSPIPLPQTPIPKFKTLTEALPSPIAKPSVFDFKKIPQLVDKSKIPQLRTLIPKNVPTGSNNKTKDVLKKNGIKSITTKSNPVASNVEKRRCNIKGVRSNRRFELLMNMRKGK